VYHVRDSIRAVEGYRSDDILLTLSAQYHRRRRAKRAKVGTALQHKGYLFTYSDSEIERIKSQAEMLRPITRRLLSNAGIAPGMRVLDIGCGAGDVSMLAADFVGPAGRVVGIDRESTVVDAARERIVSHGFSNIEFLQCDIDNYVHSGGLFDAAICRYVLIHQPEPVEFLRAVKKLVRPNGIVAVHELDASRGAHSNPRVELLERATDLVYAAFKKMGVSEDAGGRLVQLFRDAGLPTPNLFTETITGDGNHDVLLSWFTATLCEVLPRLIADGAVMEHEIEIDTLTERLKRAALDARSQIEGVPQVCGWARLE
jgi:ubiquinone/menaquinone biosynthesis C-methylase UbiE